MNPCDIPLRAALNPSFWSLGLGTLAGLAGIWGWGIAFEGVLSRRRGLKFSWAHAFVEGTVLASLLLLAATLAGLRPPAGWISAFGAALGAVSVARARPRFSAPRLSWPGLIAALFIVPLLIQYVFGPMPLFADLTTIWTSHAKALACDPLFQAPYIREKVWAGTHAEYPLFLPLLHAFFFTITDSFRDDWVKAWQVVSLACLCFVGWRAVVVRSPGRRPWIPALLWISALLCLTACIAPDAKVELDAMIFSALIFLAWLDGDTDRMPLYLFGLAFSKNEGLVSAGVFLLLAVAWEFRAGRRRLPRWVFQSAMLLLAWALVLARLPSNHEQYPSHVLSLSAWAHGFPRLPGILAGCLRILARPRWFPVALFLPVLALGLGRAKRSAAKRSAAKRDPVLLGALWPAAMILVFLAIYTLSPWGPELYHDTFERLLLPLFGPASLAFALLLGRALEDRARRAFWRPVAALTFVLYAVSTAQMHGEFALDFWNGLLKGETGYARYLVNPMWQQALALDPALPLDARVAALDLGSYGYKLTYMMYPRRFYPGPADEVALTTVPWHQFKTVEDARRAGFGLAFDGTRLVKVRW